MFKIIFALAICILSSAKVESTPGIFSNLFKPTFFPINVPILNPNNPNTPTNPSSSCSCPAGQDFNSQAVTQHNCYRTQHHSPSLTQDSALNSAAQRYADILAADIRNQNSASAFKHSPEGIAGRYGENLALLPSCNVNGCAAVDAWYNEIKDYNFATGASTGVTGHFTAVVWKGTSQVGIGRSTTTLNGVCYTVIVANYLAPGNYPPTMTSNVLPK